MSEVEIISGILAVVLLVVYYRLAKMNNFIGLFLRAIWNFWFKLLSFIPLLGWLSHFMISGNEKDQ